jgi:hypothetical protein
VLMGHRLGRGPDLAQPRPRCGCAGARSARRAGQRR